MLQNNNKSQTLMNKRRNRYFLFFSFFRLFCSDMYFVTKSFAGGQRGEGKEGRTGRKKEERRGRRGGRIDRE